MVHESAGRRLHDRARPSGWSVAVYMNDPAAFHAALLALLGEPA
jgi:hypothetical protein